MLHELLTVPAKLVDGVHVCVPDDGHVGSFSDEWDRWSTVQVDSCGYRCGYAGFRDSADTFRQKTDLAASDLAGKVVLDAGCGPGRFSEVVARLRASVVAVDLSHAVFHTAKLGTAWKGEHLFVQADLEKLPLPDACIDVAFSIGVLHHTPHPEQAVHEIARVLRPGGIFAGWVYARQATYDHPLRAAWRAFSTNPVNHALLSRLALQAPMLRDAFGTPQFRSMIHKLAVEIPLSLIDELANKLSPGAFREIVGISGSRNDEECRLDTFDWQTPEYQWQYEWEKWEKLLRQAGLDKIKRLQFPQSWRALRA